MDIKHRRIQYPVGHGFFHSADIKIGAGPEVSSFHYIFDCGGRGPVRGKLASSLEIYDAWYNAPIINLLLLSHLHDDHVNGLDQLLKTRKVDHVILPYLSPLERLVLAAQSDSEGTDASSPLNMGLISNPARWLKEHGVKFVTFVVPTPEGMRQAVPPEGPRPEGERDESELEISLKLPPDSLFPDELYSNGWEQLTGGVVIDGSRAVTLEMGSGRILWQFLVYVQPPKSLVAFENEINRLFPMEAKVILKSGSSPEHTATALTNILGSVTERNKLKKAYEKIAGPKKLNSTSLVVLSAPVENRSVLSRWIASDQCCIGFPGFSSLHRCICPFREKLGIIEPHIGWFGAGDCELGDPDAVEKLKIHFGNLLAQVDTIAIPHHGSIHNYHPDLLDVVHPNLAYATASTGDSKHPNPNVVSDIVSRGIQYQTVTESSGTLVQVFESKDFVLND